MKLVNLSAYAVVVVLIAGCAQQPLVMPKAPELQRKILTAKHWGSLADRVVSNLIGEPNAGEPTEPVKAVYQRDRPLYISSAAPDMVFSDAFKMYLTQSLVERGIRVSKTPANADIVSFRVHRFLYDHRTEARHPFNKVTFWTTLGALGWAAAEYSSGSEGQGIAALAVAGPILDFLNTLGSVTNAEVVITAFIENDKTVTFMYTEEFYVQPREILPNGIYWTDFPVVPMGEQGPMVAGPPRIGTIPVVDH